MRVSFGPSKTASMHTRHLMTFATLVLAASGAACELEPPQAPSPPPEAAARIVLPPPPPPRCEKLDELCTVKPGKRVRIPSSTLAFEPVVGWIYAQEENLTLVKSVDGALWFGAAGYDSGDGRDAKKAAAQRVAMLATMGQELGVTLPKNKKVPWKKPDIVKDVAELKVSLWELDGAARADTPGTILLFTAPIVNGRDLIGMAFVPENDHSGAAELIMRSIESISPGAPL